MNSKIRVVAGPYRLAKRYAESMGWAAEEFLIVTRAHMLAQLDPALIAAIVEVRLNNLGDRISTEIRQEIDRLRTLWPVPTAAAA